MTLIRWLRSADGRAYTAPFVWVVAVMNLLWIASDVRRRYDTVSNVQALRMKCEASGGFYGAVGKNLAHCIARSSEP